VTAVDCTREETLLRAPANRVARRAVVQWSVEYVLAGLIIVGQAWVTAHWLEAAERPPLPPAVVSHIAWYPGVLAVLSVLAVAVIPTWRYRVHRWEVSADVIFTRTGWFNRNWQLVPASRIQTVDSRQDWLERLLGLATIHVSTASHQGSSRVSGLPAGFANRLAADLAGRAHQLRDDAT
jgi:membrane protein YdbS with pleckstrin-like domain